MASLEGWNFTIKLCPRGIKLPRRGSNANSFFGKSLNHCQFFSAPCCFEPECTRGKTQFVRSRGPGLSGHLFVESGRDKCGVVAAETKCIVYHDTHFLFLCNIRRVIKVAFIA